MKKKIGILGTMNSGKTVLLTSLLWHLNEFSPDTFQLGRMGKVSDFQLENNGPHAFNYYGHVRMLVTEGKWPAKTKDFSIAHCTYRREKAFSKRDVTFVDIPGERVCDALIWQNHNYDDWSRQLTQFWSGDEKLQNIVANYQTMVRAIEASPGDEEMCMKTLVGEYRKALIDMGGHHVPCITPSTFVLDEEGVILSEDNLRQRPLWRGGDFLPLPDNWATSIHPVLQAIHEQCRTAYEAYRRDVLKPLFREIDDCEAFIVCADIFNILASGPAHCYQVKEEIRRFFQLIRPGKFGQMLLDVQRMADQLRLGRLLPTFMQVRPPKVAYVATKADMALGGEGKSRLMHLLVEMVRGVCNTSYVQSKLFTCCAGKTFDYDADTHEVVYFSESEERRVKRDTWPDLPQSWQVWQPKTYRQFTRSGRPMQVVAGTPPEQSNLDKLFDFITEDGDES